MSAVATSIAAIAVIVIARVTGVDVVGRAFGDLRPTWIAVIAGAELLTYPAYMVAYRSIARLHGHAPLTIPLVAAALWGIFAVPHDPTRSGSAPVPVSGLLRLAFEFGFFGCATLALYDLGFSKLTATFGIAVVIHYLLSYDRIRWLVTR